MEEEIALGDEALRCDASEMRRALRRGDAETAMEVHRGDLLPGFSVSAVTNFDCWLDAERQGLRQGAARGADSLAERSESAGDFALAIEWTRRRLVITPADESVIRRLLGLLEQTGDRAGAIDAFEHYRLHLRLTYDLEPSFTTSCCGLDGDRLAAGQVREIDVVPDAVEADLDPLVTHPLAAHPLTDA
jgi:DNA-binding SARP family transcriptional activator